MPSFFKIRILKHSFVTNSMPWPWEIPKTISAVYLSRNLSAESSFHWRTNGEKQGEWSWCICCLCRAQSLCADDRWLHLACYSPVTEDRGVILCCGKPWETPCTGLSEILIRVLEPGIPPSRNPFDSLALNNYSRTWGIMWYSHRQAGMYGHTKLTMGQSSRGICYIMASSLLYRESITS